MGASYYEVLQVRPGSDPDLLAPSYRWARAAVADDPDRDRRLAAIDEAFAVLSDPIRRAEYDARLATGTAPTMAANGIALVAADRPLPLAGKSCIVCGAAPTLDRAIARSTGLGIWLTFQVTSRGANPLCRDHGLEAVRRANRHNLAFGWWWLAGPVSNPVMIATNALAARAFQRLPSPAR